jgi:hypothetical protein
MSYNWCFVSAYNCFFPEENFHGLKTATVANGHHPPLAPLSEILYSGHVDIFQNKSFAFLALWTYLVVAYDIFSVKFDQCFGISSLKLVDVWTD